MRKMRVRPIDVPHHCPECRRTTRFIVPPGQRPKCYWACPSALSFGSALGPKHFMQTFPPSR